jgi:hypothetical protein
MNEYDPTSSEAMWEKHKDVVLAYQKALKKKKKKQSSVAVSSDGVINYDWVKEPAVDPESSELAAP